MMTLYCHAMQTLLQNICKSNKTGQLLGQIIQVCQRESASNAMVSLLRAITADAFGNEPERWLVALQNSTECAR